MIESSWTPSQVVQQFMSTQEYATIVATHTPESLVDGLYRGVLGREPTSTTYWAGQIRSGARTIYSVASDFMYTAEYQTRIEDIDRVKAIH
ncbi:MAG: DUF4214 domain-containing protein [Deltaproteobacteria bacterium]|nr:DUF4214 domain-containing protein [Deltaproteobacteria bacterium]